MVTVFPYTGGAYFIFHSIDVSTSISWHAATSALIGWLAAAWELLKSVIRLKSRRYLLTAIPAETMASIGQLSVTKLPDKRLFRGGMMLFVCSSPPFTRQNGGWNVDGWSEICLFLSLRDKSLNDWSLRKIVTLFSSSPGEEGTVSSGPAIATCTTVLWVGCRHNTLGRGEGGGGDAWKRMFIYQQSC